MENKIYKVTNRSGGMVVYNIPEMNNLHRQFEVGETKNIGAEELSMVNRISGGRALLTHFLLIEDTEALEMVDIKPEPEYFMNRDEIQEVMQSGSYEKFLDLLDFAPEGVLEIVKDLAVTLPLNDVKKREALYEKTGFNVDKAISVYRTEQKEAE